MFRLIRMAGLLLAASMLAACVNVEVRALDIGSRVQAFAEHNVFKLPGYHTWGPQINRAEDGKYYLVYSRWPADGLWWKDSEIALAVSDRAEGPYVHLKVLLTGRGPNFWDEAVAHNPKIKHFDGKYYLYYISGLERPDITHYRVTQKIGVAIADSITGPYERLDDPVLSPAPPLFNLAVNPGITRMPDGRFLMIAKGEVRPVAAGEPKTRRIQGMAVATTPTGPFAILPEPAIENIDTEDASLWYDAARQKFFAVFHAHTFIGLIESDDGFKWRKARHYKIVEGNQLLRTDGSVLNMSGRPLQRPSIYIEDGEPGVLSLAVPDPTGWYVVMVPLKAPE